MSFFWFVRSYRDSLDIMRLYEVFIHNQCVTYSRRQSVQPQFVQADRDPSTEAEKKHYKHYLFKGLLCQI